jgi:hypothetical protein
MRPRVLAALLELLGRFFGTAFSLTFLKLWEYWSGTGGERGEAGFSGDVAGDQGGGSQR